ncbi:MULTISPECIES: DUF3597 domain-containing protein [Brevundimonas]|jgi:hypothetical protein|uniref:DUF3597 domain-containing protein n=1 Tax=Brevundimonas fontaquae TaxID=2813778 RepID=A0ABX7LR16_9CAUL|nr:MULTISPECIES: DUF3597 domain-containing protein [Brevundimonas]MBC1183848.1 DUF3597 domain-containing protein [Brevundimonas huaxiensis]MBK1976570.1 DUF3597 domain-containing protein [Brevundimonas diminuta]QSF54460.1 DUF3597 domain-containing protein [Brevundimonas fontaquae]
MSFFGRIWDKITGHKARPTTPQAQAPTSTPVSAQPVPAAPATPFTPQPVDVDQILSQMAEMKGGGGNWRTSIVDLLKLLDLDSSLDARKDLAEELGVHAGAHGSAEQNIALSKAVWRKLAENGGQVPASLRD